MPDFDFWLVLDGEGELKLAGESFALEAGRWFLLQPGDQPAARHDPAKPLVVFACHFQAGDSRIRKNTLTGLCRTSFQMRAELAARAFQEGASGRDLASATLRQMILQTIHALAGNPAGSGRARLDTLAMEIRSAPGRDWTIAEMARRCALSQPHLNRLWRAAWGMAPVQYVIRQRIVRAIQLLRESDLSIQQIADSLGYNDVFFFHRQFRRLAGTTPRAVRLGAPTRLDPAN